MTKWITNKYPKEKQDVLIKILKNGKETVRIGYLKYSAGCSPSFIVPKYENEERFNFEVLGWIELLKKGLFMSFTPGEWDYFKIDDIYYVCLKSDNRGICRLYENEKENMESNARLISCAPEMIEKIKCVIDALKTGNNSIILSEFEQLFEKATGEKV